MEAERGGAGGALARPRLTAAQRRWLGRRLATERDRHAARRLAEAYEMSPRWFRELRGREAEGRDVRPPGRPRIPEAERARVRALVARELEQQGFTAPWRAVHDAIRRAEGDASPRSSTMVIQQETAALKRERRARERRRLEEARESHAVLARDAVWSEDTTHLGRLSDGRDVLGEVITDRGTLTTVSVSVGGAPAAADVLEDLARAAQARGAWPLVLQHDRAGIYRSERVLARLESEKVIPLMSRPHTPTDNPVAENRNREIKDESDLGRGVRLRSDREAASRVAAACERLQSRLRVSRKSRSADELDRQTPRAESLVSRERFHADARSAIQAAVLGLADDEERRRAEQDAIWRTLERHGLARTSRGAARLPDRRAATGTNG